MKVRIYDDNAAAIKPRAKANKRSAAGEVNFIIETFLAQQRADLRAGCKMPKPSSNRSARA